MAEGHRSKTTSWVAVLLIFLATVLFGFALPMGSLLLAIAGAVVLLVGIGVGVAFRIMEDVH